MSIIGVIIVVAVILLIWAILRKGIIPEIVHSHWYHYFPELQFSSEEFYNNVKQILVERKVPDTVISGIIFSEAGLFSGNRHYLRVKNGPYSFDICAAPYGEGFFVSSWFGEDMGCLMRLLSYIPIVGMYLQMKMLYKTYYIMDCETMFREATHNAVFNALDAITGPKGFRMTELERQPRSLRK